MPACDTTHWNGGWTGGGGGAGGTGVTCPQPKSGSVTASCQVSGTCMLDDCDGKKCPDGLTCVQTSVPSVSGQVVLSSACQGEAPAP
jgi:hypothetical protein